MSLPKLPICHSDNFFPHKYPKKYLKIIPPLKYVQNVLTLEPSRLAHKGKHWEAIRNNLNNARRVNLVLVIRNYDEILNDFALVCQDKGMKKEFNDISALLTRIPRSDLIGISIFNADGKVISTACGFVTRDFCNLLYLLTLEEGPSRWLCHESMISEAAARGRRHVRGCSYVDTNRGNLYFNERLGYRDFNLA
jgi:hypothetical protein